MRDAVEVFEKIQRATRTIRKLPPVAVRNRFCNWPEIIHSFYEAYGWNEPDKIRIIPTARQISELDRVICWFAWLTLHSGFGQEYTRIIWARAEKRSWRKIATMAGVSKDTCKYRFRLGVHAIFYAIHQGSIK